MRFRKNFLLFNLMIVCAFLVFSTQAHALLIDPTEVTPGSVNLVLGNNYWTDVGTSIAGITGNSTIVDYLQDEFGYDEAWKSDSGAPALSGSYEVTSWLEEKGERTGGDIEYVSGMPTFGPTTYLLVKDGKDVPVWYFFDLTALGWNYTDTIELRNFWPGPGGSISHIGLGDPSAPVPEPATLLLLGSGLIGIAGFKKKFRKG